MTTNELAQTGLGRSRIGAPLVRLVDQLASSATNALFTVLLAQVSTTRTFSSLSIVFVLALGLVGLNRAVVGDGIQLGEFGRQRRASVELSTVLWSSALVYASIVAIVGLFVVELTPIYVGLLAATTLVVSVQDGLRIHGLMGQTPFLALLSDCVWLVSVAVCAGAALLNLRVVTPTMVLLAWGTGAFAALMVLLPMMSTPSKDPRQMWAAIRGSVLRRRNNAVDYSAIVVGSMVSLLVLNSFSAMAVAQVRSATALLAPVDAVIAGIRLTFMRLLGAASRSRRIIGMYGFTMLVALFGYAAALVAIEAGFRLDDKLTIFTLGMPILGVAIIAHIVRILARPFIDKALANDQDLSVGFGRWIGETAALLAILGVTIGSPVGYFLVRSLSPVGAATGSIWRRRSSVVPASQPQTVAVVTDGP